MKGSAMKGLISDLSMLCLVLCSMLLMTAPVHAQNGVNPAPTYRMEVRYDSLGTDAQGADSSRTVLLLWRYTRSGSSGFERTLAGQPLAFTGRLSDEEIGRELTQLEARVDSVYRQQRVLLETIRQLILVRSIDRAREIDRPIKQ